MSRVDLTPLDSPPHVACQPGAWWAYSVRTESGRSSATGFAPGARPDALRVARAALHSLQRAEGVALTRFGGQTIPSVHLKGHPTDCACQRCLNERNKQRVFRVVTARAAETQRSLRRRRKKLAQRKQR